MLDAFVSTLNASQLVYSHLFARAGAGSAASDETDPLSGSPLVE